MLSIKQQSSGFTLIEVMVAISVLAVGLAGSAKITEMAYQHISAAEKIRQATYLADSHLRSLNTQVRTSGASLVSGTQSGRYDDQFRWELSLNEVELGQIDVAFSQRSDKAGALRADLEVWFDNDTRSLSFHTLVLTEISQ